MIKEFQGKYRFLSNFYPCKVIYYGLEYPSVEHAYQASKSPLLTDRVRIQSAEKPGEAKRMGKRVTLREGWDGMKYRVMTDLVRYKFTNNPALKELLLSTGNEELQEGNNWGDTYWGVDLRSGVGENQLGKILMLVRGDLKSAKYRTE